MRKRYGYIILVTALALSGLAFAGVLSTATSADLREADRLYAERSYAKALEAYQQALAAGVAGDRQVEIEYRVAVCLGRSQQWDEALAKTQQFVEAHPTGIWGARGHHWLGQLFTVVPHGGYRVGERVYRGDEYPKLETAEKPERVWLHQEDRTQAIAAFERAKRLYEGLRPQAEREEADLDFDLTRVLSAESLHPIAQALVAIAREKRPSLHLRLGEPDPQLLKKLRGHDWMPHPDEPYDASEPFPQRVLALYQQIDNLDKGRRAPQARLARAMYLSSYQQQMQNLMRVYDSEKKQWEVIPFPYQQRDAIALLQSIPKDFPRHPVAPQAQLTVGQWLEGKGDFVAALAAYRNLLSRWPNSKWISDARDRIQDIEWPTLVLSAQPARPGQKATLSLRSRNIKTVRLAAYRVALENVLLRPELLNNPERSWQNWDDAFGKLPGGRWRAGRRVASWEYVTKDTGEHKWLSETVPTALSQIGAYVVEASSGKSHAAALVLITDLALVKKTDKDRALVLVCDADTGRPVPGADVVLREVYRERSSRRWFVSIERGQSDREGLKGKPFTRSRDIYRNTVEALAWVGDRYAVTQQLHVYYGQDRRDEYRAYSYTDRPVYRPAQRVHFRAAVTVRAVEGDQLAAGTYRPAADLPLSVTVHSPRGEQVYQGNLTTSEFGTINGSFALDEEPTLGEYRLRVRVPASRIPVSDEGGSRFRVEEYKKPEFQVEVAPAVEQVRLGEGVKAEIEARYYFGSPVAGAEVKYRVFQMPYYPRYRFPRPYDWLVRRWTEGDYSVSYRHGEVVTEGEGRTDSQGKLALDLQTEAGGRAPGALAYTYTIEAEVTDESRRTITGTGEVRVSKQRFFAFLDVKRGFYQVDDRVEVEIATRDVMDRPVAARGEMRVERVVRGVSDLVEKVVYTEPIATDDQGRAFFHWTAPQAGQYRFAFQARDEWKQQVRAYAYTWVHGPDFDKAAFHLRGVQLVPDKQVYDEGEVCRLLIITSFPDSTVLLTQEVGTQIMARAVLPIKGKSRVVEVEMGRNHLPNFVFRAVMVRGWQAYETEAEIFVPPGKQFLDVSVTSDRAQYRPGEKALFTLKALDWRGKPARAELSIGVVDASLFYIQKEYAPDPRLFFYGDRRSVSVGQNWSFQWQPEGSSLTLLKRQAYKRHEWTLPEDMGQLQDWPPDLIGDSRVGRHLYLAREEAGVPESARAMPSAAYALGGLGGGMAGGGARAGAAVAYDGLGEALTLGEVAWKAAPQMPAEAELAEAQVRARFADTAFWSPAVVTDESGLATVTVTMPENLTTWRATARGLTTQVQVGEGAAEAVTRKDLIVRLQAPRFFMERDLVALSANVHNYLDTDKQVKVSLALDGGVLELVEDVPADLNLKAAATEPTLWVTVPKDGERRVDWVVRVLRSGTASVRMTGQTDEESDAMEMQFPALVHGAEKFEAQAGVMRDVEGAQSVSLTINVPKERRRGATELNLQLMPSLAAVALDSLPYLAEYPYGCIEQTVSRFLPAAVVARTLTDLGVDLDELRKRADAYAKEREAGGERQPDSAYTYPKGMPGSFDPAEMTTWKHRSPVFSRAELDKMIKVGLRRIYAMQNADGGWGWFPGHTSDPYMTAYVCYGLLTAREAGWDIDDDVLERGFQVLLTDMKEGDNLHRLAYVASVVTLRGSVADEVKKVISDRLYRNRMKLTPYSQALLAIALKQIGDTDRARILLDNLVNTARIDRENGTCSWAPLSRRLWWHWWDNPVETNAAVLRAFMAVRPNDELAPMIAKWMVNNRRGNHWCSTKETAMAVFALADYMRIKRELAPDYTITVDLDGKVQRTYRVNRENALYFDNRFIVGDEIIGDGAQTLTISVKGSGTLYYAAYLQYFSLEEDIEGGGNEIFVNRRYFKLTPRLVEKKANGRTWRELDYDRTELPSGSHLESGDLVEVELVIDAKNNYEYLVFEDMKPAGCEPVEVRSGRTAGEGAGLYPYIELHDDKVAIFLSNMPQGTRAVRYRLRAEIPGSFHGLPTNGYSMYAPEVRCLSDEWRVTISD